MRSACLLAAILLSPVATALSLDAGPLEVEATSDPTPRCSIDLAGEVCVLSWDGGQDPASPGDDNFTVSRFTNRVRVSLEASELGPEREVAIDASQVVLDHPGFRAANDSWIILNDSAPKAAREHVTLESRTLNAGGEDPPRGLLVVVHFPTPVPDPTRGGTMDWASVVVLPMESSFYFPSGYFRDTWSEDEVRPLPLGIWLDQSTDREWDILVENFACEEVYVTGIPEFCHALDTTRLAAHEGSVVWKNATPDVGVGASVERVEAEVTPSREGNRTPSNGSLVLQRSVPTAATDALRAPRGTPLEGPRPTGDGMEGSATDIERGAPAARGPQPPERVSSAEYPSEASPWRTAATLAAGGAILFWLAFALYHRISKRDALNNLNRSRVYDAIQTTPGIRAGTLKEKLGLNYETVLWHLRVLEEHHLIEGTGEGQRRFFLNGGSFSPREKEELLAASSPTATAILDHLRRNGPTNLSALAVALGISASTASETVTRLQRARLLVKRREGGRLLVLPASARHDASFGNAGNS